MFVKRYIWQHSALGIVFVNIKAIFYFIVFITNNSALRL